MLSRLDICTALDIFTCVSGVTFSQSSYNKFHSHIVKWDIKVLFFIVVIISPPPFGKQF